MSASDIPWGTSKFDCVKTLTYLKHQVFRRATFLEEPQTLTVFKHWSRWNIKCVCEWHSLRNLKLWLCQSIKFTEASSMPASNIPWGTSNIDRVEALTSLKHQVCRRATFPEEPQTLTVSKHWPSWNIKYAVEQNSLKNLKPWLCQIIELTEASSMPASNIPWGTSNFNSVEALTSLKNQMCRRAIFPEEPQTLTVSKH